MNKDKKIALKIINKKIHAIEHRIADLIPKDGSRKAKIAQIDWELIRHNEALEITRKPNTVNRLKMNIDNLKKKRSLLIDELDNKNSKLAIMRASWLEKLGQAKRERELIEAEIILNENNSEATEQSQTEFEQIAIDMERKVEADLKMLMESFSIPEQQSSSDMYEKISEPLRMPFIPEISAVKPEMITEGSSLINQKYLKVESKADHESKPVENYLTSDAHLKNLRSSARIEGRRLSPFAKLVGDRAEEIVIRQLTGELSDIEKNTLKWVSKDGQTPGWDISYLDINSELVVIEVKGTTGTSFPNIEITGNEWMAAKQLQDNYWLYLVTDCFNSNPKIQKIRNPHSLCECGGLTATPILWRIESKKKQSPI